MTLVPNDIYKQIKVIDKDVKEKLRRQGIVVPVKNIDGSIRLGHYIIKKDNDGFYRILDFKNNTVVDKINLPQSAVILANGLALGKWIDLEVRAADAGYGYALFEEILHKQFAEKNLKKKDTDRAEIMYAKSSLAKHKKMQHKNTITSGFEKLLRFR